MSFAVGQAAIPFGDIWLLTFYARLSGLAFLLFIGVLSRQLELIRYALSPMLILLPALNTSALALVINAGHFANPEYGTVASSTSGVVLIILGRFFLKERLVQLQWGAVGGVFGGVAFLDF